MEVRELVHQFEERTFIVLNGEALPDLLEAAEVIRADDTCVAGWIRILCINLPSRSRHRTAKSSCEG